VGGPLQLVVYTSSLSSDEAGRQLDVTVTEPTGDKVPAVVMAADGAYRCSYTPVTEGQHVSHYNMTMNNIIIIIIIIIMRQFITHT